MKVLLPKEKQKELTLALVIESPETPRTKKNYIIFDPEAENKVLEEKKILKAFCEKLDRKSFRIQIILDPSGKIATISFKPISGKIS